MANTTIILPCAVLGGIALIMVIFIWWWYPRTWKKGSKQENAEIDIAMGIETGDSEDTKRERRLMAAQHARDYVKAIDERNRARAEGRELDGPAPVYLPYERANNRNVDAPVANDSRRSSGTQVNP